MNRDQCAQCAYCGYVLVSPGQDTFGICMCSLPDNVAQFSTFVSHGAGYTLCPRCFKPLQLSLASGYIVEGSSRVHIFAPETVELPREQLSNALSLLMKRPVQVAFETDKAVWRKNLIRAACEPHMQLLNQFLSGPSLELLNRCLAQPDSLGKGFQMALYCFLAGYVDTRVAKFGSDEAKQFTGQAFLPAEEAGILMRLDANPEWFEALKESASQALAFAVIATANHKWTTSFGEVMARPVLLTDLIMEQLGSRIAEQIEQMLSKYDVSHYEELRTVTAFEAMHARQYLGSAHPNPRRKRWAQRYVHYQLHLMEAGRPDRTAEVPLEFAHATLSFEDVYVATMAFPPTGLANPGNIAVHRRALLHSFDPATTSYVLPLKFEGGTSSAIGFLIDTDLDLIATAAVEIIRITEDPDDMLRIGIATWRKLVVAGKHQAALDVVVPVTHRLSNTGRNEKSLAFVNEFIEAVGAPTIAGWPPREQAKLYTEVANCRRCAADPHGAREEYEKIRQLLGGDLSDPLVRLNTRNLAIVLRECGAGMRSLEMLEQLLPFSDASELVALESSLLVAYVNWGHHDKALECARKIAARMDRLMWRVLDHRAVGHGVASLLLQYGTEAEYQFALSILEEIYRGTELDCDVINRGTAAFWLFDTPMRDRFPAGQLEHDLDMMLAAVAAPSAVKSTATPQVMEMLMAHPERFPNSAHDKKAILQNFVKQWPNSTNLTVARAWQTLLHLGHEKRDGEATSEAVFTSLDSIVRLAITIDPEGDPFHVLQKVWMIPRMAAALAEDAFENMPPQFAMAASDIGASLVLSCRICAKAGILIKEFDDIVQLMADSNVEKLLPRRTAMVQVLASNSITFLITFRNEQNKLEHSLRPCPVSRKQWQELTSALHYCLNFARSTDKRDPLARVSGWNELAGFLEQMLHELQAETVVWIAGALSTTPVALAAPSGLRLSFSPSLLTSLALAQLASKVGIRPGWRPTRAFDAAVWRQEEVESSIHAIRAASAAWRRASLDAGLAFSAVSGIQASAAAISQGLSDCDVARIACHGRASPSDFASGLLVANGNNLPPSAILPRHGEGLMPYLLEWDQLGRLASAPTVVVSAACDTGQTIHSRSDERLGLERAFLLAGTLHYVAPQWPVPMRQVQEMSGQLFERWLANTSVTICDTVADLTAEQEAAGVPRWIARSLTSFGLTTL